MHSLLPRLCMHVLFYRSTLANDTLATVLVLSPLITSVYRKFNTNFLDYDDSTQA